MSELLSLVVTVRPTEPTPAPAHLGRAVHALLLRWLDAYDAVLAKRWHDDNGLKPFTCSALVGGKQLDSNTRLLLPEHEYWFRLTALDTEIAAALRARAAHPPKTVDLDGLLLPVVGLTADSEAHPWAGAGQFEALAAPYLLAKAVPPRRLKLRFVTPVSFRQREQNIPLPLPELVFGSLAERWNAFSPVAVGPEVRAFCNSSVALNSFRLRSRALPVKNGGLQIGAVGEAGYTATHYDRYWMSVLALLADFAFYAGVGRLVTMGFGQAIRSPRLSETRPPTV